LARTGIFGGSFNPIHYGHLLVADQVLEILGLDRLLFVPAAEPPHKPARGLASAPDRLAMVQLAVARQPRFAVSDVELRRRGPSYTVDTLEALSAPGDELVLIIGSETFLDLLHWHAPHRLVELARLAVVPRTGSAFDPEGAAAQKILQGIGAEPFVPVAEGAVPARGTWLVHAMSLPVSASDIRERVRTGRSVAFRLPPEVIAYMNEHALYRGGSR
jgi:nicotinate-nucleotide adenylyltransferase